VPVRREGQVLYGRGSVDAKGPLCAFAAAAARVTVRPGWRITVVGAVEEESATSRGARYILSQRHEAGAGQPAPVFCIIGEPSQWDRITLGYKGRLLLDVTLRAPFSHSAGEGQLPAEQGVNFWREVEEFCRRFNQELEATTPFTRLEPSLRHITSRDEGSYGAVELSLGFRLPVGLTPPDLEEQVRQLAATLPAGTSVTMAFSGAEGAYKGDKTNSLVRAFLGAIRAAGGQPRFVVKTGTADMNVVAPHWPQTPIVAYGPGDSSLDHTPDEHLDLAEYEQAIQVLHEVLERLMREG
jgi:LysW-gamma-L-lysine carboxypeptidase